MKDAKDHFPIRPVDETTWCLDTGLNRPGHTCCYLLHRNGELAFIDCGATNSIPVLLQGLATLGYAPRQVRWILPTHVHLDHAGGAGRLLRHCPDATLATHHKGLPHLVDPSKLQKGAMAVYGEAAFENLFGTLEPAPQARCQALHEGDELPLGDTRIRFIETPGHANHHGCFFHPPGRNLFTGDTFGLRYPELDGDQGPFLLATTTPVAFNPEAWRNSLEKMMALQPQRACLTHFGPLETPHRWLPRLQASLDEHVRLALETEKLPQAAWQSHLETELRRHVLDRARRHAPELPPEEVERLLEIDIGLNAQGLAVWLARRARKREKGL